jgi:3-methyl-2-oxobutanoate hydroxymethyltransferase
MGGYRVQGRTDDAALKLLNDASELEQAGAFAIVLEGVPMDLAREITEKLSIPTIGIGAGPHCDGQVLVVNDVLGLSDRTPPKFVKRYANVREQILTAVGEFKREVEAGSFPDDAHSYH